MFKNIRLAAASLVLALPSFSAPVYAAPNCNEVAYGSKCMRCSGWANMSAWAPLACHLNSNPTVGFACYTFSAKLKCGALIVQEKPVVKLNKS